jgi:NADH:ubiquinone oxidoreductase subunit 3 (subunit A)
MVIFIFFIVYIITIVFIVYILQIIRNSSYDNKFLFNFVKSQLLYDFPILVPLHYYSFLLFFVTINIQCTNPSAGNAGIETLFYKIQKRIVIFV